MVAWALNIVITGLITALPREVSVKVMQRWKPQSFVNSAPRIEDAAYVRAMVTMKLKGRNSLLFEHDGHIHVVVVDQRDADCHVAESFLWSDHVHYDARKQALKGFYGEYVSKRLASLIPRLAPADTKVWYDVMEELLM